MLGERTIGSDPGAAPGGETVVPHLDGREERTIFVDPS